MWWYQRAVPLDVRTEVGRAVIQQSLGTSDIRKARRLRDHKNLQWELEFEQIREKYMPAHAPTEKAQQILRELRDTLAYYVESDAEIKEAEADAVSSIYMDKAEKVLRRSDHIPLSFQRGLLQGVLPIPPECCV